MLAQQRVGDHLAGFTALTEALDRLASARSQVEIALETDHGLFVHALRNAGFPVFGINPKAVDRYRDRYRVSRAKSDPVDALVLANLPRIHADRHREIPADSSRRALSRCWPGPSRMPCGSGAGDRPAAVSAAGVLSGRAAGIPGSDDQDRVDGVVGGTQSGQALGLTLTICTRWRAAADGGASPWVR